MLKSRSTRPPGGWKFTQPESGWSLPVPDGVTFSSAVDRIITHRNQNPRFNLSTDRSTVEAELDNFTCARLKHDPSWCIAGQAASFTIPPLSRRQPVGAGASAVTAASKFLSNTFVGIKTWISFFGDGKPVAKEVANKRASACLSGNDGKMCPFHVKGDIFQRFNKAAATEIMGIMGALKDLDMHSERESELGVCDLCDCPMSAKIWAPLPIIKKHMEKKTFDSLPEWCWIKAEG